MLSSSDAALVARDRTLPGLATLLDTAAFTEVLRDASPALAQATVQPRYVRYKPATRCLVAYDVRAGGGVVRVHASAYPRNRWDERLAARLRAADDFPGSSPIQVHDHALVITAFPEDARLGVLKRLWDPLTRLPLLRKLLPEFPALHNASIETLAYNPERRYVARLTGEGTCAVIKLYADGVFVRARAAADTRRPSGLLQTPRCIGRSRRHRALVLEWLPGERLTDVLQTGPALAEQLRRVGAALSQLHRQRPGLATDAPSAGPESLLAPARGIRALWPPLGDRAERLASMLAFALADRTVTQRIHGDFYAAQVLLDTERVGILDLDRASSGDPMADVGNFVAHLEYAAIDGSLSPAVRDLATAAFIQGYEQAAGTSAHDRIDPHVAAGLLRLGVRPFRVRAADWAGHISAILDRVDLRIPRPGHLSSRHTTIRKEPMSGCIHPAGDRELGLVPDALDAAVVARRLTRLPRWRSRGALTVSAIRLVRHKKGRRCLIEYDIEVHTAGTAVDRLTVIGKVKAKGADRHTFELTRALWRRGFRADDGDGISVPEPIGVLPEWKMWLQAKVAGTTAGSLLGGHQSAMVGRRAAEAIHKLQRANIASRRSHTAHDELRILRDGLSKVAAERPDWTRRLENLADGCSTLLASLPAAAPRVVHRDFHPGQLIIDGDRVHLLDLDLYAAGDPALDAGNFIAHVTECGLRELGRTAGPGQFETAMMHRFLELEPAVDRRRLEVYALVSLARHVYISTRFLDRLAFTGRILEYCEHQLAGALRKLATTHADERVRAEAIESLGESDASRTETADFLERLALAEKSQRVQSEALETLADLHDGAGIASLVDLARNHPSASTRQEALKRLLDSDHPDARALFERALKKTSDR